MKQKWINFVNPLIKQGNSFCIRIPKLIVDQLKAKQREMIAMQLSKVKISLSGDMIEKIFEKAKQTRKRHKNLKNFTDEKLMILSVITLNEAKAIIKSCKGKITTQTKKEKQKQLDTSKKFRQNIKKEFGDKIYKNYSLFAKILEKETQ